MESPQEFKKYGFEYQLLARDGKKVLYRQILEEKVIGYEVQLIHSANQAFPKHEDFGYTAWAFRTEQEARVFYQNMVTGVGGQAELPF